ncbi:hypothetical protein KPL71_008102 [Citrus sinensis]|uniref:Uncharacterized protein n=1 Tax=Citrus sinensis TaxID=2711 RepID=A0ACB8M3S8_CITSI|nr:hypothetical protein KPL71_008102 [Citrus sinensis]
MVLVQAFYALSFKPIILKFDPEIERTCGRLNRERKEALQEQQLIMADEAFPKNEDVRPLRDYVVPTVNGARSSIARPAVQANNFEIKPAIIQMIQTSVQFAGMPNDDPNAHIANFLEICDTFKQNSVSDNAIRLRLFSFSLMDKAKECAIQTQVCELCGGNHTSVNCQVRSPFAPSSAEQAHYVSNFHRQQNNPYFNTYNPGWKNHPNLSGNNTQNTLKPPPGFQSQEKKSNLEDTLTQLTINMFQFMTKIEITFQNQAASIRNLEVQIGALKQMPSYAKFMKEILSNKRKLEEHEIMLLTEESTAILQNKLPPKLKDPEYARYLEALPFYLLSKKPEFKKPGKSDSRPKHSIEEPPKYELKPLPSHLRGKATSSFERPQNCSKMDYCRHQRNKPFNLHEIPMEESYKPTVQPQKCLNPNMQEVVRAEVLKLLDAGIIYPISDSSWASPVQVVLKKGGMMVMKNDNNELIPTRTVTAKGIEVDTTKIDVNKKLPPLTSVKAAFNTLKEKLISTPVIMAPDWDLLFEVICDASDYAIGAVLGSGIKTCCMLFTMQVEL